MARKSPPALPQRPIVKDKDKALRILKDLTNQIEQVKPSGRKSPHFSQWRHNASIAVANIFGENSQNHLRFIRISYSLPIVSTSTPESAFVSSWLRGLDEASGILNSLIDQVETYWEAEQTSPGGSGFQPSPSTPDRKVFIVHGHSEGTKQSAARLLEKLSISPVILHEQPNQGKTIIEKFETYSDVPFALVILTADDVGRAKGESELTVRARQNVLLELGFFLGRLGRGKVCALYEKGVEIPSDFSGILFVEIDSAESWHYKVAKEIKAAGISVDLNLI